MKGSPAVPQGRGILCLGFVSDPYRCTCRPEAQSWCLAQATPSDAALCAPAHASLHRHSPTAANPQPQWTADPTVPMVDRSSTRHNGLALADELLVRFVQSHVYNASWASLRIFTRCPRPLSALRWCMLASNHRPLWRHREEPPVGRFCFCDGWNAGEQSLCVAFGILLVASGAAAARNVQRPHPESGDAVTATTTASLLVLRCYLHYVHHGVRMAARQACSGCDIAMRAGSSECKAP
jgi:hypothetical protein